MGASIYLDLPKMFSFYQNIKKISFFQLNLANLRKALKYDIFDICMHLISYDFFVQPKLVTHLMLIILLLCLIFDEIWKLSAKIFFLKKELGT